MFWYPKPSPKPLATAKLLRHSRGSRRSTKKEAQEFGYQWGDGFLSFKKMVKLKLHPWRLTWNIIMKVWKFIFLSTWAICMFHVNLPGCICQCFPGHHVTWCPGKHWEMILDIHRTTRINDLHLSYCFAFSLVNEIVFFGNISHKGVSNQMDDMSPKQGILRTNQYDWLVCILYWCTW